MPAIPRDAPYGAVWSSHPLAAGIASAAGLRWHAIPGSGIEVIETAGAANGKPQLVILDALRAALASGPQAWRAALAELELRWFAPLVDGLKRGALSSLTLHALGAKRGYIVTVARLDLFKFWRARRALNHYIA
jgi:hypothetical protein